jgi:menaquinone-dependent protoporphyrinogen IX oxidase
MPWFKQKVFEVLYSENVMKYFQRYQEMLSTDKWAYYDVMIV